jgi:hypothetical protein
MLAAVVERSCAVVCRYRDQYWQSVPTRKARRLTVSSDKEEKKKVKALRPRHSVCVLFGTALPQKQAR